MKLWTLEESFVSTGERTSLAHLSMHVVMISSNEFWMVPNALLLPDCSWRMPLASSKFNSLSVTTSWDDVSISCIPKAFPEAGAVPDAFLDRSFSPARRSVSWTISAPWKWVPEKALSTASIASWKVISPSSLSSASSNADESSIKEIIPVDPCMTAGEELGSSKVGRAVNRNFSRWHNRPTISCLTASL